MRERDKAINTEEVEWVAGLARLRLTPKQRDMFTHQLGQILEYVKKLEEVSVKGVEPASHPPGMLPPLRDDRPGNSLPASKALSNAPKEKESHFRVPPVVKKSRGKSENPKSQ